MTTQVTVDGGVMTVETHAHGGSAYVAEIIGTDQRYGLARDFAPRGRDVSTSRGNVYRDLRWRIAVRDGAVYEISSRESSSRTVRYYYRIDGGSAVQITHDDAVRIAEEMPTADERAAMRASALA